jgi:hypothetical protein
VWRLKHVCCCFVSLACSFTANPYPLTWQQQEWSSSAPGHCKSATTHRYPWQHKLYQKGFWGTNPNSRHQLAGFFFFFQFCDVAEDDFARFGYILDMKVEKNPNSSIFLATYWNLVYKIRWFGKKKLLNLANLGNFLGQIKSFHHFIVPFHLNYYYKRCSCMPSD